jgi:2-C-methyl-D-erythritol 4-phosphate cytidylyltransferase
MLVDAYRRAKHERIVATDDAALCEQLGVPVQVVRGAERALKVTEEGDFARAEALFAMAE